LLVVAGHCDTLTFINNDTDDIDITFGTNLHPKVYAGLSSVALAKEHTKTITLSERGTYQFYDRTRPDVKGSFAIVGSN
jgi:plastocyanin